MKRTLIFLLAATMLLSALPFSVSAAEIGAEPGTVKLVVPEAVTLTVNKTFAVTGTRVEPSSRTVQDGMWVYTFNGLAAGNYCYTASGAGYYKVKKDFAVTAEKLKTGVVLFCDPGKTASDGFQPTDVIYQFADEVYEKALPSDPSLWPAYEKIFVTPAFTKEDRAAHQQTTEDEMMEFLRSLDDENDDLYLYLAGKSPVYGYDIPVVLFTKTDLSGASTLEKAAALVAADGRPTVHYQAEIHANEPAGGEGALAMIASLDGEYGEGLLDKMNICVIPRVNADGAKPYQRANVSAAIDMNRDHLLVSSTEVELIHSVYQLFMPIVAIDGHEFTASSKTDTESGVLDDVEIGSSGSFNTGSELNAIAQDMVHAAFEKVTENGLRPFNYPTYASTVNNAIGRAYYGLYGSLSFLVETLGIGTGLTAFPRRVVCQYIACETFLNYTAEHLEEITKAVAEERERLVRIGATYEQSDTVVLQHSASKKASTGYTLSRPKWNFASGTAAAANATYYSYDTAVRSRPRPTAYVIPKGEAWADKAVSVLEKNFVSSYELAPGSIVLLQQYAGSAASAALLPETEVTFPDGAYVFPMNQVGGNVLAMTMEPDVADSQGYNGTLVQSGIVRPAADGTMPIYRYIHDLSADGTVETVILEDAPQVGVRAPAEEGGTGAITGLDAARLYEYRVTGESAFVPAAAGSTEITGLEMGEYEIRFAAAGGGRSSASARVQIIDPFITEYAVYLDPKNGNDSLSGRRQTEAVRTVEAAYRKLSQLMTFAPEDAVGRLVLLDTLKLTADYLFPACKKTVMLTSATGAEGLRSEGSFGFSGDTVLENLTLTLEKGALRYISANGHDFTVGENVSCVPTGGYYYCLVGGGQTEAVEGGTSLTVRSGTWRNIYAAGYKGSISGNAVLTVTGGSVTNLVQTSYSGRCGGSVTMLLSGAKLEGGVYGGNASSADVAGSVNIVLGAGLDVSKVFAGSRDAGKVVGTASIVVDGAEIGAEMLSFTGGGSIGQTRLTLSSGIYRPGALEPAPKSVRLDVSAGGTLTLTDSLSVTDVWGGGTVVLPAEKTLETQTANDVTVISCPAENGAEPVRTGASVKDGAFVTDLEGKTLHAENTEGGRVFVLADAPAPEKTQPESPVKPELPEDPVRAARMAVRFRLAQKEIMPIGN